ncbi:ferrochelatase [Pseudonocardia asaccharolytica]|uniref:Coproporphyrin III ferrochelatase n=1 Tax=Pseudonocardia asaccharolytica DSM 44247 = NBRC 16224 TaxID=1123024 RepID=A0A511D1C5_9PSEU|nr:ferrochelatase [Pseudonocardia asaccharolytica]GEL16688.1 ferrochelatase [Pseudonocardia asaccharolytica DSM 44247 = NBRC 16224]
MSTVDALLVLSFGGPEHPDDVRPFLENVVRGRDVPPERLDAVEEHYRRVGGVSPLNARNRELIAAIRERTDLPVYFGNRNWHPMVSDTVAAMARNGVRRALVLATSAYGGYSACRQYDEDIAHARAAAGPAAPELVKLRHFFDHPLFVAANADAVRAARARLPAAVRDAARLVFTAHSIPTAADAAAGPPAEGGHRYSRQVAEAARLVAAEVGAAGHDLVWQSRSGPPQVPWLEPDVLDHIEVLHARGAPAVVIAPVGFVSDHVEVVWDLDTEAAGRAAELGMGFARAATAGPDPRFADMVVELIAEHTEGAAPRGLGRVPRAGCTVNGAPCAVECCLPARHPVRPE